MHPSDWVAVVGSRAHPNLDMVAEYVRGLTDAMVISGGAVGVDLAAQRAAKSWTTFLPRDGGCRIETSWGATQAVDCVSIYSLSSRGWPILRNTFIAAHCHRMVVFPDGSKGGCWDAAREAVRFRKPVEVRWADGRIEPFTASRQSTTTAAVAPQRASR
jgi:hypothetical protein